MDSRGNLIQVANEAEAKRSNLVPVPPEEHEKVQGMSVEERVAWFHQKLRERTRGNRKARRREKALLKSSRKAKRKLRAKMKGGSR